MPCRELILAINMLQRIMVRKQHKITLQQVRIPMLQGLNNRMELHIVGTIVCLCLMQLLTEIRDWPALLAKDNPDANL